MKPLAVVLTLLLAAFAGDGRYPAPPKPLRPPAAAATVPHPARPHLASPRPGRPALSARIVLPSTTIPAGWSVSGRVVVENGTGQAVHLTGCSSLFQVVLGNADVRPDVAWLTCLEPFTIPVGATSYPVTVVARYLSCGPEVPSLPCTDGHPPSLPPGNYRAMLFQSADVAPAPAPIEVRVTV